MGIDANISKKLLWIAISLKDIKVRFNGVESSEKLQP